MSCHARAVHAWVLVSVLSGWGICACALADSDWHTRLSRAVYQEETLGDVTAAIDAYQQLADEPGCPADIAAEAQLRAGLCLRRLGQTSQARALLSHVASAYPDLPAGERANATLAELGMLDAAQLMPEDVFLYVELVRAGQQFDRLMQMAGTGDLEQIWLLANTWMRAITGRPEPSPLWQISRRRALAEQQYLRQRLHAYEVLAVESPELADDVERIRAELQRSEDELSRLRSGEPVTPGFPLPEDPQARAALRAQTVGGIDALHNELRQARGKLAIGQASPAQVAQLEVQVLRAEERLAWLDRAAGDQPDQKEAPRPAGPTLSERLNNDANRRELGKVQSAAIGLVHVDSNDPQRNDRFLVVILPGDSRLLHDLALWMGKTTGRFVEERNNVGLFELPTGPILGVGQDVILFGQDVELLRGAVDRVGAAGPAGLAAAPGFRYQLSARRADSDLLIYADAARLLRSAEEGMPTSTAGLWAAGRELLGLDALGDVLCSVQVGDKAMELELSAAVDAVRTFPLYAAVRTGPPSRELLRWMPADGCLAILGGVIDGQTQWQQLGQLAKALPALRIDAGESTPSMGSHPWGLALEPEHFAAVTDIAVIWPQPSTGQGLSIDKAVFVVRLRDWSGWLAGLRSLAIGRGAEEQAAQAWAQSVHDSQRTWVRCALGYGESVIYAARVGSDCLLSTDRVALETVLDAESAGQTAEQDPAWRTRLASLPKSACKLAIGRLDRLRQTREVQQNAEVRVAAFTMETPDGIHLHVRIDSPDRTWWSALSGPPDHTVMDEREDAP
jgi:tetratricopeptide (TPR) repeat protein